MDCSFYSICPRYEGRSNNTFNIWELWQSYWFSDLHFLTLISSYYHKNVVSQFSHSVMSDSLWPHELQHARPPCPSPTPRVHSNSRPSSRWCPPAISSSVIPFSSCPQSLPASESFPMSQLFSWGGQNTGVSAFQKTPGLIFFRMDWLDLLAV